MFAPRAVFQELFKGHCYTIYQDPPTGKYYLKVDCVSYVESGKVFKGEIADLFLKLKIVKERDTRKELSRH